MLTTPKISEAIARLTAIYTTLNRKFHLSGQSSGMLLSSLLCDLRPLQMSNPSATFRTVGTMLALGCSR